MKKFLVALSMAWGNFSILPCPYKRWDSKLSNYMLAVFPLVGVVIGGLWALLAWGLLQLQTPVLLLGGVLIFWPFAASGWMHLDGFMDVCDAVLSRRDLGERQRILKDPHTGSFAVCGVIFLLLFWVGAMGTFLLQKLYLADLAVFFLIPVVSRFGSALWVMSFPPMATSQYAQVTGQRERRGCLLLATLWTLLAFAAASLLWGQQQTLLLVAAVELAVSLAACLYGRHSLGGMNGDIAGYSLCLAELAGMLAAALQ